jgi:hypothetical protein
VKHPRYIVADAEAARQRRAAEFAQDFERPPGIDPASRDNAPPIAPDLPTHWEACSRSELEYLAGSGTYGQRLIARRCLIDLPNSKGEA